MNSPEILDEMKGVIREIVGDTVFVSLFCDDEEFCLDIPKAIFENNKVPLRENACFNFHVEKYPDGLEVIVVTYIPPKSLTLEDYLKIEQDTKELLEWEMSDEEKLRTNRRIASLRSKIAKKNSS